MDKIIEKLKKKLQDMVKQNELDELKKYQDITNQNLEMTQKQLINSESTSTSTKVKQRRLEKKRDM
jgi:hypothetical protein